ncbi:hypothetical protein H2203_000677 [Taxawa tesnikishii (nom. ined.)]|nr:hypothetical protein H2203_000677 [Dothideales sp. JES 119]
MFKRSFASKDRAGKAKKIPKSTRSFRDDAKEKLRAQLNAPNSPPSAGWVYTTFRDHDMHAWGLHIVSASPKLTSSIVTLVVGKDQRLFAAHEDVLCHSPFFAELCRDQFFQANSKRIALSDEEPEIISAVLEYLYKGDYTPRLLHDRKRNTWMLEDMRDASLTPRIGDDRNDESATIHHHRFGERVLRDTVVYCTAERFGLEELKRLALRKQGLQSGIEVATILHSARYAYENTPETDSRLRAHYLALIIRSRKTFKRSGTMQMEMEKGGKLWFDLFVALSNYCDDLENGQVIAFPKDHR